MLFTRTMKAFVATALLGANMVLLGAPVTEAQGDVPAAVDLETAGKFAILSETGATIGAFSSVTGDIGVSPLPSASLLGFGLNVDSSNTFLTSSSVNGNIYAADLYFPTPSMLFKAIIDMRSAYADASGRTDRKESTDAAGTLDGRTITSGVYRWGGAVTLTTTLTFDGSDTDVWIIQVGGALSIAAGVTVQLVNGAKAENIFWAVGGAVALGAGAHIEGVILSQAAITTGADSSITGAVLAQAIVTLGASSTVVKPEPAQDVPVKIEIFDALTILAGKIGAYETPIQIWMTMRLDQAMWNCITHYHPTALNAITKTDPNPRAPEEFHNTETRAQCMVFALNKLVTALLPTAHESFSTWLSDDLLLDSSVMSNEEASQAVISSDFNSDPRVIGSLVAMEIIEAMNNDGWNYLGLQTNDGICVDNCRPFTDYSGYHPKYTPWHDASPPYAWQPLKESDMKGFFYDQEHITPHIGFHATPAVLTREELDARTCPGYETQNDNIFDKDMYTAMAETVIDDVASLTPLKEGIIYLMNNKLRIAVGMIIQMQRKYNLSLEAQTFYSLGYTSSEHDAVLLAWKEKINHDDVRPTSVIHAMKMRQVTSYEGDQINAKDWQPFIHVQAHAEYPSGSGCLCKTAADYTDAFIDGLYPQDTSISTTWEMGPGVEPKFYSDMSELYHDCGESRLWGGMHFRKAVDDSYSLVAGVGTKGFQDYMMPLLGSGTYADLFPTT